MRDIADLVTCHFQSIKCNVTGRIIDCLTGCHTFKDYGIWGLN